MIHQKKYKKPQESLQTISTKQRNKGEKNGEADSKTKRKGHKNKIEKYRSTILNDQKTKKKLKRISSLMHKTHVTKSNPSSKILKYIIKRNLQPG